MEDSARSKQRLVLYGVTLLYLSLALLAGISADQLAAETKALGYIGPPGWTAIAVLTLLAAIKGYRGGLWFIAGTFLAALSVVFISVADNGYLQGDRNTLTGGIALASIILILAALLFWQGQKRHRRIAHGDIFAAVETAAVAGGSRSEPQSPDEPLMLYPPMRNWRVFLLMLFSASLYSCFLMYRIARDLRELGQKQLHPLHCAWQMLIPLYNFTVFLNIAKHTTRLARQNGIAVKFSPTMLMLMLIAAYAGGYLMPDFLFVLAIVITAIPWLILNQRMNRLRCLQTANFREAPDRFSWRQRFVLIFGLPFIALGLLGSKSDFSFYVADRLEAEQTVSGQPALYQLTIPDRQWRQVAVGTLYPDTDMELLNKKLKEWVVVRVLPNQQQTLDTFVDQRKAIIAASWNNFEVEETRTFAVGADMVPISLARYTKTEAYISQDSPLFVATLVTANQAFEVIGHGSVSSGSSAWDLVKSFRLLASENTL
ncbi:MAG: hypothetical protein M0R33_23435 [Methylomonas sp.]|jgi:phage-related protein|uniref:hypothetical protein n=1 Tax=Methylomonas sp. TaxID=418 RepID=UPI0025DE4606|nr:hypothetical protein [Methylomonas sp.]MCK9609393.1 hypothetical protein [Methylomonas sp.]